MPRSDTRTREWTEQSPNRQNDTDITDTKGRDESHIAHQSSNMEVSLTRKATKYVMRTPVVFGSVHESKVDIDHMRRYRVFRSPQKSVIQSTIETSTGVNHMEEYDIMLIETSNASQVHVLHAAHRGMTQLLSQIEFTMAQILSNKTVSVDPDSPLFLFLQQRPHIMESLNKRNKSRLVPISEQSVDSVVLRLLHLFALLSV